ncbi:hypothetical protein [Sphingobacterium suaedae]
MKKSASLLFFIGILIHNILWILHHTKVYNVLAVSPHLRHV